MQTLMKKIGLDDLSPALDINNGMLTYALKPFPPADVPYFTESFIDFEIDVNWYPDNWARALKSFYLKNKAFLLSPSDESEFVFHSLIRTINSNQKAALVGYVNVNNQSVALKLSIGKASVFLVAEGTDYKVWVLFSRVYQIWEIMGEYTHPQAAPLGYDLYLTTNVRFDQIRYHSHVLDCERKTIALSEDYYRRSWIIGEAVRRVKDYLNALKTHQDSVVLEYFNDLMSNAVFSLPPGKHLRALTRGRSDKTVEVVLNIHHLSAQMPLPNEISKATPLTPLRNLIEALSTPIELPEPKTE